MEPERLSLFKAAVRVQINEVEKIFKRIQDRRRTESPAHLESLAYQLHNLYCAFEDLFKVVADFFENRIEERAKSHRELLWRMKIPIEGVRPALLSEASYRRLDALRAFRHFFRHAYAYELDPRKVSLIVEDALALETRYRDELDHFLDQLEG